MKKKPSDIFVGITFIASVIVLVIYYYIICFYQMRKGDDILFSFYNGYLHYLDDSGWRPLQKVTSISEAIQEYMGYYMTFSGRIGYLYQGITYNLFGERIISFISAIVYTLIILTVCRLGLKSWRNVVRVPALLLFCSFYMYQFTATGSYICMWTFVCQYAITLLLILLYYLKITDLYVSENIKKSDYIIVLILGLLCGWSHECLSAFAILMTGLNGIVRINKHQMCTRKICLNIGLYLGYLIIFVAPGNYKRMHLSHDIERSSYGVIAKLGISMIEHLRAAGLLSITEMWMFGVLLVLMIWSRKKKQVNIKKYLVENIEFIAVAALSVLIWAVFAPPVPQYGLQLWKACLIILCYRLIDMEVLSGYVGICMYIVLLFICTKCNIKWIPELVHTTQRNRQILEQAIEDGKNEAILIAYPESTSNYLTNYNLINRQYFEENDVLKYYGLHVYIK